jgi:DNA-binding NarL/FixJ family response regulator
MPHAIQVSIISDSRILRDAISAKLIQEEGIELLGAVGSVRDLLQGVLAERADVVLIHSTSAPEDMAGTTWELKRLLPSVKVVVAGCRPGEADAVEAIQAGASACLENGAANFRDLIGALKAAAEGRATGPSLEVLVEISRRIKLRSQTSQPLAPRTRPQLSARETEVVRLLAVGTANKKIARRLGIKPSTAKNHVHNVLRKMDVKRRRDLIGVA